MDFTKDVSALNMHVIPVKDKSFLLIVNKKGEAMVYNLDELIKFWNLTKNADYDLELDFHYKNF